MADQGRDAAQEGGQALGKGKRRASPPSHEHPEAPPARRQAQMDAEVSAAVHQEIDSPSTSSHQDLDPNRRLPIIRESTSHAGSLGQYAASSTGQGVPGNTRHASSHRTVDRQHGVESYVGDEYEDERLQDDAATTSTEHQEREDDEERAEARYQLGRRLNLQRIQAHLNTIATVLQMYERNGEYEKLEVVRAQLETIIDGMNQ
ncbi:hypothetical protein LTR85_010919 [Meristemomyces frigidus]|nr:hypothetical protein LTR85_010919 [Meristemomyces frigidus]